MGQFTLEQMSTRVQRILGNRGLDSATLRDYVNIGYGMVVGTMEFESEKECAFTDTVAGQEAYDLPPLLLGVIAVIDTTNRKRLRFIDLRNWAWLQRDTPAPTVEQHRGFPRRWSRRRGHLLIWPTPKAVYRLGIFYYKELVNLSGPGDVTQIAGFYDWAIINFAAHAGFAELGEDSNADKWLARGSAVLSSRMHESEFQQGVESMPVRIARSADDLENFEQLPWAD